MSLGDDESVSIIDDGGAHHDRENDEGQLEVQRRRLEWQEERKSPAAEASASGRHAGMV